MTTTPDRVRSRSGRTRREVVWTDPDTLRRHTLVAHRLNVPRGTFVEGGDSQRTAVTEGAEPGGREQVSQKRIARAFSMQLIARVFGMLASVVTVSATTRYLGPESYGHLTTAIIFVTLFTSFTELGIGSVIVRRVSSGTGDLGHLVRLNSGMSIVLSGPLVVITVVAGLLVYNGQTEVEQMLLIVAGSLLLTSLGNCFDPIFMATVRFSAVALSDLVSRAASLAAVLVLVTTDASVLWFAAVQLVPPFVLLIIQGIAGSRIISWRPYFSFDESWDLLRESLPQTGVLIIGVLYWRADGLILTLVSDTVEVGVYGLAYTVAFTASVVSTFYLSSTLSSMTDRFTDSQTGFARFVESSMRTMAFVALPVGVAGLLLGPGVIELMGSSAFVPSGGPALSILFVAVGLTFLSGAISQALFAAHQQVFLLRLNVINLAINIGLNLVLIPIMGAKGAAISLVFSETCGLVVASWKLSKVSPYRTPWMFLLRSLVPLGATVGVLLLMADLPVILAAAAAAIAYFVVSAVAGPMTIGRMKDLIGRGDTGVAEPAPKEGIPV